MSNLQPPNGKDLHPEFLSAKADEFGGQEPRVPMPDEVVPEPLFEVIVPSPILGAPPSFHFRFYSNGYIEGFDKLGKPAGKITVINRVPLLLDTVANPLRAYLAELNAQIDQLAHTREPK